LYSVLEWAEGFSSSNL